MISKRISRKPQNDNYAQLANYVRDARPARETSLELNGAAHDSYDLAANYVADIVHGGEKMLFRWHEGCEADSYELGIQEVLATQSLNTRSKKEKTYHMVVSFHPEDEAKLTEQVFHEIEQTFAQALGFIEHQRHCGVHKNTSNIHMHIAYNMIHPDSLTRHEPFRDYHTRDCVCRALEKQYGLMRDNGITLDIDQEPKRFFEPQTTSINHGKNHGKFFEHIPKPYAYPAQRLSQNRVRRLSKCRLAQYDNGKKRVTGLLSADARPHRRRLEPLRRPIPKSKLSRVNDKARTVEAHTGQQSFDGYVQERRDVLLNRLDKAQNWQDVHDLFATYGLAVVMRGNGMAIADKHGKHGVKLSSLDRSATKSRLEARFGIYAPSMERGVTEQETYTAKPLQQKAERGELYAMYQTAIVLRKTRLQAIKDEKATREAMIREKWKIERQKVKALPTLHAKDRFALLKQATAYERVALKKMHTELKVQRNAMREAVPFWNWTGFLRGQVEQGNEMALAILRSHKEEIQPEVLPEDHSATIQETAQGAQTSNHAANHSPSTESLKALQERWRQDRKMIQGRTDLLTTDKRELAALSRMYQLVAEEKHIGKESVSASLPDNSSTPKEATGFTWRVDNKGTVLFYLKSGGLVRDSGKEITFSAHDPVARSVASKLAKLKFGKEYAIVENKVVKKARQEVAEEIRTEEPQKTSSRSKSGKEWER